jgi:hypothetical protein
VQTIVVVTPADLTNKNPTWRFYYYAGEARIAMRVINGANDLVFFLFADYLGSTDVTRDPSGQIVGLSLYMPWGESRAGGAGTRLTDYGFTGQLKNSYICTHLNEGRTRNFPPPASQEAARSCRCD